MLLNFCYQSPLLLSLITVLHSVECYNSEPKKNACILHLHWEMYVYIYIYAHKKYKKQTNRHTRSPNRPTSSANNLSTRHYSPILLGPHVGPMSAKPGQFILEQTSLQLLHHPDSLSLSLFLHREREQQTNQNQNIVK